MNDEQILEFALANGFKLKPQPDGGMSLNPYVFDFARALLAAAPTPPAQEDEPVALIKVTNSFGLDVYEAELTDAGVNLPEGTKLYTRPDNSELRKAAEAAIEALEWYHQDQIANNLRAALEGK